MRSTSSSPSAAAARSTARRASTSCSPTAAPSPTITATARRRKPMLPMLAVPTTAGTGSEAQSYAVLVRRRDAHQDGVRRARRGVPRGGARPRAHGDCAGRRHCGRRHRRGVARRGDVGDDATVAAVGCVRTRGVAPAERRVRAGDHDARGHRGARRHAAWAPSTPGWRSSSRCWARRTRARTR